jgi:hypothetical protein
MPFDLAPHVFKLHDVPARQGFLDLPMNGGHRSALPF